MSASAEKEITITRVPDKGANVETSVTFQPTNFARGKNKELGIKYPGFPEVTQETLQTAIDFFGWENFLSMTNENIRLWMQQVYNAVIAATKSETSDGFFDEKMFISFVEELSTRGESKAEIEEQLARLRKELVELVDKTENATELPELLAFKAQFQSLRNEVKKYDAILASKKRVSRKADEDEDKAA